MGNCCGYQHHIYSVYTSVWCTVICCNFQDWASWLRKFLACI